MTEQKSAAVAFISTVDIAMPSAEERAKLKGSRGGKNKTVYDFAALAVGKSIAVLNRTAKQLTSTLSSVNNGDRQIDVLDDKGKPVTEPKLGDDGKPMKDEAGKVVMTTRKRKFFVVPCDPATDPEKAIARIWREV